MNVVICSFNQNLQSFRIIILCSSTKRHQQISKSNKFHTKWLFFNHQTPLKLNVSFKLHFSHRWKLPKTVSVQSFFLWFLWNDKIHHWKATLSLRWFLFLPFLSHSWIIIAQFQTEKKAFSYKKKQMRKFICMYAFDVEMRKNIIAVKLFFIEFKICILS